MKRRKLSLLLVLLMLVSFIPRPASAQRDMKLWVEGRYVTGDVAPILYNNRTLVPLRQVSEALGIEVEWNNDVRQALIVIDEIVYAFLPGESFYGAGDEKVEMDTKTVIQNNRIYLPLRVIAEALGKPVSWDDANSTAVVGTGYSKPTVRPANNTFEAVKVERVVDGDTIVVSGGRKVRMILVDTPETKHPKKGVECYGREASNFTTNQLTGKTVYLQKDVSDTDRYGRLLRYVWIARPSSNNPSYAEVGKMCFNSILIEKGYGKVATFPPDVKYGDYFLEKQQAARSNGTGLWGQCPVQSVPKPAPTPTPKPTAPKGPVGQGYIKGNRNSKIYHLPGGASYNKISPKNIVYFNSEAEAQAAGYRRAKR